MKIPFNRTLKEFSGKDISQKFSALSLVLLKFGRESLKLAHPPNSVILTVNGYKMRIYPKRLGIHRELYLYGKRELGVTDFLLKSNVLKKGDAVLDIGANIGYYVLLESKMVGNLGKVYAVEPVGNNMKQLRYNLKLNGVTNVSVSQFAFGAKDSVEKIFISEGCNWSTLNPRGTHSHLVVGTEDVKVKTVDSFLRGKQLPKLIRMDVEGYEHEILKGMPETLKKGVKLLIEVHTTYIPDLDSFFELLEKNGYSVKFSVFENREGYSKYMQTLSTHSGVPYSSFYTNMSIRKLKQILKTDKYFPNVLFERCD
jgi:FkbM family methyltransferase